MLIKINEETIAKSSSQDNVHMKNNAQNLPRNAKIPFNLKLAFYVSQPLVFCSPKPYCHSYTCLNQNKKSINHIKHTWGFNSQNCQTKHLANIFSNLGFQIDILTVHKIQPKLKSQEHALTSPKKNLLPYLVDF